MDGLKMDIIQEHMDLKMMKMEKFLKSGILGTLQPEALKLLMNGMDIRKY